MVQLSGRARFLLEAMHRPRSPATGLRDQLDRDVAAEAGVARAVDLPHAAGTQPSHDFVAADPGADLERRLFWQVDHARYPSAPAGGRRRCGRPARCRTCVVVAGFDNRVSRRIGAWSCRAARSPASRLNPAGRPGPPSGRKRARPPPPVGTRIMGSGHRAAVRAHRQQRCRRRLLSGVHDQCPVRRPYRIERRAGREAHVRAAGNRDLEQPGTLGVAAAGHNPLPVR